MEGRKGGREGGREMRWEGGREGNKEWREVNCKTVLLQLIGEEIQL